MPLPVSAEEVTAQLDVIDEAKAELAMRNWRSLISDTL